MEYIPTKEEIDLIMDYPEDKYERTQLLCLKKTTISIVNAYVYTGRD